MSLQPHQIGQPHAHSMKKWAQLSLNCLKACIEKVTVEKGEAVRPRTLAIMRPTETLCAHLPRRIVIGR